MNQSNPISTILSMLLPLVVIGGMLAYYFLAMRKAGSPMSMAAAFAAAGYRPGETNQFTFMANVLPPSGSIAEAATHSGAELHALATFSFTTHGRLYFSLNGLHSWFEGPQRPQVRLLGHIMTKDTTGVFDALASQRETTFYFVAAGQQPPPGSHPKLAYNFNRVQEPVAILELTAQGQAPMRIEVVASGAQALLQWTQPAPGAYAPNA